MSEEELAAFITRDCMIGVAKASTAPMSSVGAQ
jgi:hypothetical protein